MSDRKNVGFEFFHNTKSNIPVEATFTQAEHSNDHILNKRTVKYFPEDTSAKGPGSIARFHMFHSGMMLDPKSMALFMDVQLNSDANGRVFDSYAGSLFKSITLRLNNSFEVHRIEDANILHNAISWYTLDKNHKDSVLGEIQGYKHYRGYANNLYTHHDSVVRRVMIRWDLLGLLTINRFISMDHVRSLDIEIQFDTIDRVSGGISANNSAEVVPATATYSDLFMKADIYEFSVPYKMALTQAVRTAGLYYNFPSYEHHLQQILPSRGTQSLRFRNSYSSLKAMFCVFECVNDLTISVGEQVPFDNEGKWHGKTHAFPKNYLTSWQCFADGLPVQNQPVNCKYGPADYGDEKNNDLNDRQDIAESVFEVMKTFEVHADVSFTPDVTVKGYGANNFVTNNNPNDEDSVESIPKFMIAIDFEKSSLLSGQSVEEIRLDLNFSSALAPVQTVLHTYFLYDTKLLVQPGLQFLKMN